MLATYVTGYYAAFKSTNSFRDAETQRNSTSSTKSACSPYKMFSLWENSNELRACPEFAAGGGTGIRTPRPLRACRFSRAVPCHSVIPPQRMVESWVTSIKDLADSGSWAALSSRNSEASTAEFAEENKQPTGAGYWLAVVVFALFCVTVVTLLFQRVGSYATKTTKGFAQRTIHVRFCQPTRMFGALHRTPTYWRL